MDMDPAERGGVEWVSEICSVKGSSCVPPKVYVPHPSSRSSHLEVFGDPVSQHV